MTRPMRKKCSSLVIIKGRVDVVKKFIDEKFTASPNIGKINRYFRENKIKLHERKSSTGLLRVTLNGSAVRKHQMNIWKF